jgi:hypothetical protein
LARGYRAIALGTDSAVLISALQESVARIKDAGATVVIPDTDSVTT